MNKKRRHTKKQRAYPLRTIALLCISLLTICSAVLTALFYWPRSLIFSYDKQQCVVAPTFLPGLASKQTGQTFDVTPAQVWSIGSVAIYAHVACISAKQVPTSTSHDNIHLRMAGSPLLGKRITVQSSTPPTLSQNNVLRERLSTRDPLVLTLNKADTLFEYVAIANNKRSTCVRPNNTTIACDIARLALAQDMTYTLSIERIFQGKPASQLVRQDVATVEPISIVNTSIGANQTVFDAPNTLTIELSKAAASTVSISLENQSNPSATSLPTTTRVDGARVHIDFTQPLPRSSNLILRITSLRAQDGAYLTAPFELPFSTSGGPKVLGVSIGKVRVQPHTPFTITLDSPLAEGQNIADYVRIHPGGIGNVITNKQGTRLTIQPNGLGRCMSFTVTIIDGLKNIHGISGGSAWSHSARTLCQTVSSLGNSVLGRPITAYSFGTGASKIVFVGGTHGDEQSSTVILQRWIEQLELNPQRVPAHQTIIIIPVLNPDGYATSRRTNANGVDLNRNFPAANWKSGVTMPNKSFWPTGGGSTPLSEPESQALARYIQTVQPRLVLTYHAAGNIVQPNRSGDSTSIAIEYARKSSVGYLGSDQTGSFFEYDTTGAFEDWLHDALARPALLVELKSRTSNDYNGHQQALWYIAGL